MEIDSTPSLTSFSLINPISTNKEWFEFLLDLNLLDNHLINEPHPEPNASSLIIQFLYHANLTEQLFSTNAATKNVSTTGEQPPPIEIKTKRIKVLRILAVKAASLLDWNLLVLEKEVPIAVMSDLLHLLLRVTIQNNDNKSYNQLDLKSIEPQGLFALQLLHRWCIRTVISSKYQIKPSKTIQVNVPGIINPLQHMKEANENILKTLVQTSVIESIEFLEKFLLNINDVIQPRSSCFTNINGETGEYGFEWSNGVKIDSKECEILIKYDLAQYYFLIENYQKCFNLLNSSIMPPQTLLNSYCSDYESLLFASKSIVDCLVDQVPIKSNLLSNRIENSINNNFQDIFDLLIQDNKTNELSMSYRLNIETKVQNIKDNEIIDQICSCNIVRSIHDNYFLYKNYDLSKLNYLSKAIIQSTTLKVKANMKHFIEINLKNFTKKCQQELEKDSRFEFVKQFDTDKNEQQFMDFQEISPSSPTENQQNQSFSNNASSFEYVELAVKSFDPVLVKHAITNYNQQQQSDWDVNSQWQNKGMRNFWTNEWNLQSVLDHLQSQQQALFQNNLNKINSINDMDFIVISLAKIKRLKKIKKYDLALKLLKSIEDSVKNNEYLLKFIVNETLILNIKKVLNEDNANLIKNTRFYDSMLSNCKTFISNSAKNDSDSTHDALQTSFAFVLNSNEYKFIENQSVHKTSASNLGYVEISKKIVKFCIESQSDKGASRKTARELWECIVDIFSDSSQQESSTPPLARESLRKLIKSIKNTQILSVLFSLMSTLYTIRDTSCNTEVTSEYRQLWPSSLAIVMNSINLNFLHDILNLLIQQCMNVDPYNVTWLRTIGDIYFSQALFTDSLKFYLQLTVCETKYFFQQSQIQRVLNEKLVRNMMRSCFQLNKFTHVACLSQYLPVIDYATAFKCFQEEFCLDNMDDMFICIWDVALLEYLIFINSKRAYFDKRNLCMNICALPEINESNPKETRDKNIELKRILLFLKLIKYYFF